jgi:amidase
LIVADSLMARSVRDVAWAFAAAQPTSAAAVSLAAPSRRLRIGLIAPNLKEQRPHAEVERVLQQSARLCDQLGHRVEPVDYPFDCPGVWQALHTLWSRLGLDAVQEVSAARGAAFAERALEPWTWGLAHYHLERCGVPELEQAYDVLAQLPTAFNEFHRHYDVLLTPTLSAPPPPLGVMAPDQNFETLLEAMFDWISYTPLQNLAGTPAISLPLGQADGLPIGVQFAADRGQEPLLLQLAAELEHAAPWRGHWPAASVVTALQEMH